MTDTELLDCLQELTDQGRYGGHVVLRQSSVGRGWRLHETKHRRGYRDVREAIEAYAEVNR